ncbi:bacillibactin ABC transporter integral membrane protein [Fontibacillus phaseoli]|uniref:Bacillibactin ABC transporter integral membrane protein n=1 Tax=Fontibacillus phaseoli TaxID=1416533 RepID=A0A369BIP5_9BACL|nr:iron ABC transporter permease [Fontibacillus phaseoli]RCX20446.1 bacillibactin ABC transporter integral membrane protein [Fontibacillus phaseoli]
MRKSSGCRTAAVLACGVLIVFVAVYFSLTNGTFDISVINIVKTILRIDPQPDYDLVVFDFRLPRIVLGAGIGFALGIAGCVLQGITRNGLADPGILGINAGAGMTVVLFMFLFQGTVQLTGWLGVMTMPLFGLAGGVAATVIIFLFAKQGGKLDPQRLILVGIAMSSGFGAVTLYVSLKMNPQDFEMAAVWLSGSLHGANWKFVAALLPWLLVVPLLIWWRSHVLDLFQMNEDSVKGLGVAVEREKKLLLLLGIGLVSASVSVSGAIGFVGLIAPHLARQLVGLQHKHVLPVSGVIGMAIVVISDFIGKTLFAPAELAVGIVVSILGVPYFVYLLIRSRK